MLTLKIALLCIAGLLDIIFSILVIARDHKRASSLAFFVLAFSMGGWSLGIAAFLATNNPEIAFAWAKLYYFFPLLISASLIMFALSFPSKEPPVKPSIIVLFFFSILAGLLLLMPSFVTEKLVYHPWGKEILLDPIDYATYGVYLIACFSIALHIMYKKSRSLFGLYRLQAAYFFVGFTVAAIFGVAFNLILPGLGNYKLIWLGPLFTTTFIVSIAYSIFKHKMFDIRLVIARSISYAVSLTVLSIFYGFVVFGLARVFFEVDLTIAQQLYLSLATGIAGLSFGRFRKVFDKFTNRIFYQDSYDAQLLYDQLNKILVSTSDITRLMRTSTTLLADTLKADFAVIGLHETEFNKIRVVGTQQLVVSPEDITFIRLSTVKIHHAVVAVDALDEEKTSSQLREMFQKYGVSVLVRLSPHLAQNNEGLGYLLLGNKKSGKPYTEYDYRVLDTISRELIIAIQNALRYEEIENFATTLQAKVDEQTRKLRRTNEKLKQMDETKDDFISMASHQLRTPLTSIKGYLSMVLEEDAGKVTPMQREMLGQAFFSSQRMVYLIADLLNVSRLKTGKFVIERAPVNLAEVVEQELSQLNESAAARGHTLKFEKPKDFPAVMLDETKTRQVIMNFTDNAIYYTPNGGHITVKLINTPSAVELRVVDDGIGVPKTEQPHLFTKFYRAGNARQARPDGTGLGLYMAKKVIVAQGGSLIFESKENEGSTFGFNFDKAHLAQAIKQG